MSDDETKTGGADRVRINIDEDYEVHDLSQKFGVKPDQLKATVKGGRAMADAVERYLKAPDVC